MSTTADSNPLPATPAEAVGTVIEEKVILEGRTFRIRRPAEPDLLLENPAVVKAFERDEYMPYWADLWPAARMLGKALLRRSWPPGLSTLELGCGLGLPGIVGLSVGLDVTFSDYDATALQFAADNARLNGFHKFQLLQLDWRNPPELQFPLMLASDLIYEVRNVEPIVHVLLKMLSPGGVCLLTDQDRKPAPVLCELLQRHGFQVQREFARAGQPNLRVKGSLYTLSRPGAAL